MSDFLYGIALASLLGFKLACMYFARQERIWEFEAETAYNTGFRLGRVQGIKEVKDVYSKSI